MTTQHDYEKDYRPVLVREETKNRLQGFRRTLPSRDINQERRLVTAGLEFLLARPDLHEGWLQMVPEVVKRDIASG